MKKILIVILALTPICSFGQLIDELPQSEDGRLNFNEVIHLDSMKKDQLYLNAKQFFVETFKSANNVVQMDDKEAGIIIGKGFTDVYSKLMGKPYPVKMWFTVKIQSKDGRYKYEIYDIFFETYSGYHVLPDGYVTSQTAEDMFDKKKYYKKNGEPLNQALYLKDQMMKEIETLKTAIKSTMIKAAASDKNDSW